MNVSCKIRKSTNGFEGTVAIDGLRPAKLVRGSDQSTLYATRAGVYQSAQALAKRIGANLVVDDNTTTTKAKVSSSNAKKTLTTHKNEAVAMGSQENW